MSSAKKKTVLITGGANGIGLCTAQEFAQAGYTVVITDIRKSDLDRAAKILQKTSAIIRTHVVDVSNRQAVKVVVSKVQKEFGKVDILINNAGVGFNGELAETGYSDWERLMKVNFWGVLNNVYAFLPSMIKRRSGHIVNISSGQSFFRLPTWGAYTVSKLAVAGFSEILSYELKKFNIKVTTVFPFMVNTGFYSDAKQDTFGSKLAMKLLPYYSQTPEKVANIIFKAVVKNKKFEMVHPLNNLVSFSRSLPLISGIIGSLASSFLGKKPEDYLNYKVKE